MEDTVLGENACLRSSTEFYALSVSAGDPAGRARVTAELLCSRSETLPFQRAQRCPVLLTSAHRRCAGFRLFRDESVAVQGELP